MQYYVIRPEVAGGLGEDTEIDHSSHPPIISKLHYYFDDWLGDAIVESFPVFLVTAEAGQEIEQNGLTGGPLDVAKITTSELFEDLNPTRTLPEFLWLKAYGTPGRDDIGIMADGTLVLSGRAKEIFEKLGMGNAEVYPFTESA